MTKPTALLVFFMTLPCAIQGQTLVNLAMQVTPNTQGIAPERAHEKRIILPGDVLLPQMANGELAGGHTFLTLWEALNITDSTASFEVRFFDGNGSPMTLPLVNPMNPTDF